MTSRDSTVKLLNDFRSNEGDNPGTNFNIMNQIGEPEDIAAMAALLASDAGRYCNGVNFVVDGGETAQGIQDSLGS